MTRKEILEKTIDFDDAIHRIIRLEEENAELKCECRRCVYTDCPCTLSDYGKDRNGICDHFKDVFDENVELKEELNYSKTHCLFHSDCPTQKELAGFKLKVEVVKQIGNAVPPNFAKALFGQILLELLDKDN